MSLDEATLFSRVQNISSLREQVLSPQPTYVRKLLWRIVVEPVIDRRNGQNTWLSIYLQCDGEDGSPSWCVKSMVKIRIMPQLRRVKAVSKEFTNIFHSHKNHWGFEKFIGWQDLLDASSGYVRDDYIDIEVHVKPFIPAGLTSHLKEVQVMNLDCDSRSQATLRFMVRNISCLSQSVTSPPVMIRNLPWRIVVELNHVSNNGRVPPSLEVNLKCDGDDLSPKWSCMVVGSVKLKPQKPRTKVYTKEFSQPVKFNNASPQWGYNKFIEWWSLMDPAEGYVNEEEDFVELEIDVNASAPCGIKKAKRTLKGSKKESIEAVDITVSSEHLTCPICFELPRKEVYQCRNGHLICVECISSVKICPLCRVNVEKANAKIRNRAIEAILDTIEFKCSYKEKGCAVRKLKNELIEHEYTCEFQYAK